MTKKPNPPNKTFFKGVLTFKVLNNFTNHHNEESLEMGDWGRREEIR